MYVHNPETISASNTEMEISEESASTSRIHSSVMALSQSSEFQLDSSSFTFKKEFDVNGYDVNGFNKDGYHKDGYEHNGCGIRNKKDGYRYKYIDRRFDKNGCDKDGNRYLVRSPRDNFVDYLKGYNYDKDGYNVKGFNQKGLCRDGSRYDKEGYDSGGYDRDGYNRRG
ncbi:hypothetical protein, partial [Candidatus Ichthyocystis hellenicum]|uniref:hypothetical protein n=1 Tax=Candidatus Ichthyocystis hellenicum TaxID=1561003 RepID=UPI001F5EF183